VIDVRRTASAIGIFVLGLAVRAATWPRIFAESGIMPPQGADEFYHLRRIWYTFLHFPETLSHDPYVNYPVGGEIIMAPGFDLAVAGLARALVHTNDQAAVEVVAAWVPAVLGALTAVCAAAIAARVFSPMAGLIAGVLLAVLPGHYFASQIGNIDHHVAVSLEVALLFAAALAVARRPAERNWGFLAFAIGIGSAAFLLTWPGSLLHVALLQGLAIIWMIQARSAEVASSRAWHLMLAQGVAALALVPHCLGRSWSEFGSHSPLVLSSFQPLWFATAAISCGLVAVVFVRTGMGMHAGRRWLVAVGVALFVVSIALIAVPGLSNSLVAAAGWFVEEEENFLAGISEIRPLFGGAAGQGEPYAQAYATRLIYVYPLALVWMIFSAARNRRSDLWIVAVWAAVHYGLVLAQIRFLTSFAVSYTIVWGGALAALIEIVRRQPAVQRWPVRAVVALLAMSLLMFVVRPSASLMGPELSIAWKGPEGARPSRRLARARAFHSAAAWLHENSPATDGYLDPTQQPQYGVLAMWDMGHLIRYVAERPLVQDNFGIYGGREQFLASQQFFGTGDEKEALRIVEQLGARYVLIDNEGAGLGERGVPDSMADRLYVPRGGRGAKDGRATLALSPLRHHRLIMETSPAQPGFPHVMIYEIVKGAQIQGRAVPGAVVNLRLPIRSTMRSAAFTYSKQAVARADGRYRFVVPYSTGGDAPIRTGQKYLLRCGAESAEVEVSEPSVVGGATVSSPALRCLDAKR